MQRFDINLSNFYDWFFDAEISLGLLEDLVDGVTPPVTFVFRVKVDGRVVIFSIDQLEIHPYWPFSSNSLFTVFLE